MRGACHIGVLDGLAQKGVFPPMMVGSSAGALVAALAMARRPREKLAELFQRWPRESPSWAFTWWGRLLSFPREKLPRCLGSHKAGERWEEVVEGIEAILSWDEMAGTVGVVATDLLTGQGIVFGNGPAHVPERFLRGDAPPWLALRASSAIPGLFAPVKRSPYLLADGALVAPVPAEVARLWGAAKVVAVDLGSGDLPSPPPRSASETVDRAGAILLTGLSRCQLQKTADLVLQPLRYLANPDTWNVEELVAAGKEALLEAWPALEKLLS
ncbi:MAG: patatin-like phospholipase family protein [Clostridiales bacterium]|nr:patatin-like phospholipase family protein [Clostridiales bacterium]